MLANVDKFEMELVKVYHDTDRLVIILTSKLSINYWYH
jgi:hypothetical protein